MKKGFGLIEVLAAAVVLGFLLVGLATLQKGNRESILRVRARDAANVIAQEVIDSLSSLGSASVRGDVCSACEPDTAPIDGCNYAEELCKQRIFEGQPAIISTVNFRVTVDVTNEPEQLAKHETEYTRENNIDINRQFAKQVDVTVNWDFKKSTQSINMSTVIR
ncbi:MAG: type II secretion system GspH family protein [Fibromonadales bacterium]|nr:type II secretion system GspH family protein [Fibromonadales bacterium]